MRVAWVLFTLHAAALVFGLAGLLIALPNPHLWAGSPSAAVVFNFGMRYAGSLHIILGALTMVAFGVTIIGWRPTAIFFALSTTLSLGIELLGTGTGWPFGAYSYTDFLGYKALGRVPLTIPLSWFQIGFASYLLASVIARRWGARRVALWAVPLGVWLLTVWDLVLDPAMAHESLPVKFWVWHETGPYFGMPLHNFIGWAATGALFMGLSRFLWGDEPRLSRRDAVLPFAMDAVNTVFAIGLSLAAGLWQPVVLALALGVLPAMLALVPRGGLAGRVTLARSLR